MKRNYKYVSIANYSGLFALIKAKVDSEKPITPSGVDCTGAGHWEFGTKSVGSLNDEASPFIAGPPPGQCAFIPGEKDYIVGAILNEAKGTPGQKIAVFTMGAPGCGKSSAIDNVLSELGFTKDSVCIDRP